MKLGPVPWWLGVFAVALATRLAFLFLLDEPLLYSHQYNYFSGGLSIAEHPHPLSFVLRSDEWHTWNAQWTMAPLYHLFLAAMFRLGGSHLLPVQLVQCLLESTTAVLVGAMARAMAGPRGAWAGLAYALYWPAIELPSRTLTENVHTPLLVAGMTALVRAARKRVDDAEATRAHTVAGLVGGALLGLSALARAISLGFLPLAALAHAVAVRGWRRRAEAFLVVVLAGTGAILPWSARNALILGDPVLIETVGVWNLWTDNAFVDAVRYDRQAWLIAHQPSPAAGRALAVSYARKGIREHPGAFAEKAWDSFRHFFRPQALHLLLDAEEPDPFWRQGAALLLDDAVLVAALVLFVAFLLGGGPGVPGRSHLALWTCYYLLLVVVVFHNEIRYRSAFVPFVFAGAAGGWTLLAEARARRPYGRAGLAAAAGMALGVFMLRPFVVPGARAVAAWWTLRPAERAIERGDLAEAERISFLAAQRDWQAGRPWIAYGGWMARAGHPAEAVSAYQRALLRNQNHRVPPLVLPRLLRELGRADEAEAYQRGDDRFRLTLDPWLALEIEWRELPPPRTDAVRLARGDEGAVRGFLQPRDDHRWSRHRAWVRLIPSFSGNADLVLDAGSPEPSPLAAPVLSVRVDGGRTETFTLSREIRRCRVRTRITAGVPVLVELRAPTWNKAGLPAEQGVRVDRVSLTAPD